jgi:hypothetical protein
MYSAGEVWAREFVERYGLSMVSVNPAESNPFRVNAGRDMDNWNIVFGVTNRARGKGSAPMRGLYTYYSHPIGLRVGRVPQVKAVVSPLGLDMLSSACDKMRDMIEDARWEHWDTREEVVNVIHTVASAGLDEFRRLVDNQIIHAEPERNVPDLVSLGEFMSEGMPAPPDIHVVVADWASRIKLAYTTPLAEYIADVWRAVNRNQVADAIRAHQLLTGMRDMVWNYISQGAMDEIMDVPHNPKEWGQA